MTPRKVFFAAALLAGFAGAQCAVRAEELSTAPASEVAASSPAVPQVLPPQPPQLKLVYPFEGARMGAVSSSFVFGSVSPATASVSVNGVPAPVHRTGSFLVRVPFSSGSFTLTARAESAGAAAETARTVTVAGAPPALPSESEKPAILAETVRPSTDATLMDGDLLIVRFRGTPNAKAFWRLRNLRKPGSTWGWRPMVQTSSGTYEAFRSLRGSERTGLAAVEFRLENSRGAAKTEAPGRVQIKDEGSFLVAEVSTAEAILRTGPARNGGTLGYDLFLPRGTRVKVTGAAGPESRVELSRTLSAWTDTASLKPLPEGTPPPCVVLGGSRTENTPRGVKLALELGERPPYRAWLEGDLRTLSLTLYGAVSDLDRLRYADGEEPGMVRWKQTASDELEVRFTAPFKVWGYDVRFEGGSLVCELLSAPKSSRGALGGLTVAVDPGHSPRAGDGAIGPQGIVEGRVAWDIAEALKKRLESGGAKVILTRDAEEVIELAERGRRAWEARADIFVSVHLNAVPDGADPRERGGFSVYYFQPQSRALALAMHASYRKNIPLKDDGFHYGNLAVCRPTQMPAVLTESGYLIQPAEEEKLLDPAFQKRLAEAMADGITRFVRDANKD